MEGRGLTSQSKSCLRVYESTRSSSSTNFAIANTMPTKFEDPLSTVRISWPNMTSMMNTTAEAKATSTIRYKYDSAAVAAVDDTGDNDGEFTWFDGFGNVHLESGHQSTH